MIQTQNLAPFEIHRLGIEILTRELGVSGMLEFIEQYEKGSGDYTKSRYENLNEKTIDELVKNIYKSRNKA